MTLPDLPLEIWETIVQFCDAATQYKLRAVSQSWRKHVDRRIIPYALEHHGYRIPDVSVLLFNGFHQYRNNVKLEFVEIQQDVYHPYKETVQDYALFKIVDPLRYFKLNRMEDVEDLYLLRDCTNLAFQGLNLREAITIRKKQLRKEVLIGPDEQSLLLPYNLLWRPGWEVQVPVYDEASFDGVAVSIYGMGTPNQTWTSTFSSGANLPY